MSLTEFLTARLDEDEAVARHSRHDESHPGARTSRLWSAARPGLVAVCADSGRVLAEVEAKRRIVEMHSTIASLGPTPREVAGMQHALGKVVALLALPYTDHADYDEGWRP